MSINDGCMEITLNSPITEEQWDAITDVDFEHTNRIWFHTKHGKNVEFAKVVHGHWIQTQAKDENGNAYYSCSVCGSGECHVPEVNVPYCWKCGSKMDEVTVMKS